MVKIEVVYQGQLHCQVLHTPSGAVLETDAPKDNMGKGEYFSPTDLLAAALGSCVLTLIGIAAGKLNIDVVGTHVTVEKKMITSPIRRIGTLGVNVIFSKFVEENHRPILEQAALTCPVHKSLHPDIAIPMEFIWA